MRKHTPTKNFRFWFFSLLGLLVVYALVKPNKNNVRHLPSHADSTPIPQQTPAVTPRETPLLQVSPTPVSIKDEEEEYILPAPSGDIENLDLVGYSRRKKQWFFLHTPTQKLVKITESDTPVKAMTGRGEEVISIIAEKIDETRVQVRYDAKGKVFDLGKYNPAIHAEQASRPLRPILGPGTNATFGGASVSRGSSSPRPTPVSERQTASTVYITNTGDKYHGVGCRYLDESQVPVSTKNAKSQGYTACQVCSGN